MSGTTIGRDDRMWLVSALGFELEMELAPLLVLFRYDDVPGVIGKVGTPSATPASTSPTWRSLARGEAARR